MKSAMGDALKGKLGSLKGPADVGHPLMGGDAAASPLPPPVGGGDSIDLSKVDPALIQAIIKELTESKAGEASELPMEQAQASGGLGLHSEEEKEGETDAAPHRKAAVSAIADGGAGHEAGSLRSRAAAGAKHHLSQMKGKGK